MIHKKGQVTACAKKSTNIQEKRKYSEINAQKNANMLQCGSKCKYFVEIQYEDWKVCRKEKKHSVRRDRISEVLCQNIACKQKKLIKAFKQ